MFIYFTLVRYYEAKLKRKRKSNLHLYIINVLL